MQRSTTPKSLERLSKETKYNRMKKEEFKKGLAVLISGTQRTEEEETLTEALEERRKSTRGRPRKNAPDGKRTDGYERASVIVSSELWAKLREICYKETLMQKEVLELALELLIGRYEEKHGTIKPRSHKQKDPKSII